VVPATISSTVMGMTLIAIGEGIVLGVAYWVAGVPSPVTLGVLTGIMALIPGGAPLSFTLVSIYLLASGSQVAGLSLFVWGTVELFIVDKTLRPEARRRPDQAAVPADLLRPDRRRQDHGLPRPVHRPGADGTAGGHLA
jgi:hypothetical protein